MNVERLKELQKDIEEYGEYLEKSTYHPYDRVQGFARELRKILEEHENHKVL